MGNKPFNYHWDGKTLAFASELHAILALPWVREVLNEGMLAEFLAGEWYSRDETFWQGIMRLVAAHRMVVDAAGRGLSSIGSLIFGRRCRIQRTKSTWSTIASCSPTSSGGCRGRIRPVAFEVSGGLDSSAIFAMAEHLRRQTGTSCARYRGLFP